jgi:hypothetical protein
MKMAESDSKADRYAVATERVLLFTLFLCAVPFFAIIGLKEGLSSRYSPKSADGCYFEGSSKGFMVRDENLISSGVTVASAKLSFFKGDPYLSVDPGIELTKDDRSVTAKPRRFPEEYPFNVDNKVFSVEIVDSDGQGHILNYRPRC